MKHAGLVIAWYNRSYTVTGSFAQCQAALAFGHPSAFTGAPVLHMFS